jgi:hypothetical protein
MDTLSYQAIGPDRPLGDRDGSDEPLTPERVAEISKEEVKTPQTGNDIDEEAPDDPDQDERRRDDI